MSIDSADFLNRQRSGTRTQQPPERPTALRFANNLDSNLQGHRYPQQVASMVPYRVPLSDTPEAGIAFRRFLF
jgi:hypothetical protein